MKLTTDLLVVRIKGCWIWKYVAYLLCVYVKPGFSQDRKFTQLVHLVMMSNHTDSDCSEAAIPYL